MGLSFAATKSPMGKESVLGPSTYRCALPARPLRRDFGVGALAACGGGAVVVPLRHGQMLSMVRSKRVFLPSGLVYSISKPVLPIFLVMNAGPQKCEMCFALRPRRYASSADGGT